MAGAFPWSRAGRRGLSPTRGQVLVVLEAVRTLDREEQAAPYRAAFAARRPAAGERS